MRPRYPSCTIISSTEVSRSLKPGVPHATPMKTWATRPQKMRVSKRVLMAFRVRRKEDWIRTVRIGGSW